MAKPLSNTQELIELTLWDILRREVVSQGYVPDVHNYPDTVQGSDDYAQAMLAIATGPKGFAVEVFNNSNPEYKGIKKLPRIVLLSEMMVPGDVGGDGKEVFTPETVNGNQIWNAHIRPPQTIDFTFTVHVLADNAVQVRILNAMVANALPLRGYIPAHIGVVNNDVFNIYVENISFATLPYFDQAMLEYSYRYQVKDLFFEDDLFTQSYAPLQEIALATYVNTMKVRDLLIN